MIELASVIMDLRAELDAAISAAEGEALQFELGTIELEATLGVQRTGGTGGKVRFWVVELGADGSLGQTSTHRIKLSLSPTLRTPAGPAKAFVSGQAGSSEE
ncbi:trypco2 family protein [Peterkaempfera sp. SMS 1(5)a]|uniref:trypco2 family protein n=1 Tax=Peterkaempfera podocarpi TaxID=3232308 RepID=UPI00366A930A